MNSSRDASPPGALLVYGAYGKTGAAIAKIAAGLGHEVVLSGSNRDRLQRLAAEIAMPAVAVRLDDQAALREVIRPAACVINVAGPFGTTFRPMVEACSAVGVPYVDLNGELDVFREMEDFAAHRQLNIPVLPGAGFGVVAGEGAAMLAAGMIEQPRRVWVGLMPDLGTRSPGAVASTLRALAQRGVVVENGGFAQERVARRSFSAVIGGQRKTFMSMPLGELWAVRRSTGVSSVIAGAVGTTPERILMQSGVLGVAARSEKLRQFLAARMSRSNAQEGHVFESYVWARAEDSAGKTAEVVLRMGEGYQWSAEAAVRIAEHVATDRRPGLWTPGQYLGKAFVLSVPSTKMLGIPAGAFFGHGAPDESQARSARP
jgi:short subunit dehydrogenase-like uncharacterized protein